MGFANRRGTGSKMSRQPAPVNKYVSRRTEPVASRKRLTNGQNPKKGEKR